MNEPTQNKYVTAQAPELSFAEYQDIQLEIFNQPAWRRESDKAAEYYDGNQYDADTLQALAEIGMSPQIENLIAPTIDSITGLEAKTRKDWKVAAQSIGDFEDVTEALGQKLFEAERETMADRANSDAFKAATVSGISWLYVGRQSDPFKYPYVYEYVHRNEIFYDMKSIKPDYSDGLWLVRSRWYDLAVVQSAFPDKKDLLELACYNWSNEALYLDNGKLQETLAFSLEQERSYRIDDQEWRDSQRKRLRLNEVWYRRYVRGNVIKLPNGVVEEFDKDNPTHMQAAYAGFQVFEAAYSKVRVSIWVGPHKLIDMPNPYKHGEIPYVRMVGKMEDLSRIPYGLGRSMIPMQDEINARNTKQIWLLAAKRITATDGITVDDIETVRQEAARPDAVHILDAQKFKEGGIFKVESDFALNSQQYQALVDKRNALKNVSGVYAAFEGSSNNQSGVALHAATEQSSQTLATIYDNYEFARARAGNMLLSLIMEDIADNETQVNVEYDYKQPKNVVLNKRQPDGTLSNAVNMARAKVALSDVPSTSTYKAQTLNYLTQMANGLPPQIQGVLVKFMIRLTDIGSADKQELLDAIAKLNGEQVNRPPKNEQEAMAQQQAQQQMAQQQEMMQRAALAELTLKEAQALKAKAEAEHLMQDKSSQAELERIKQDYENMLIQAKEEYDTKLIEIQSRSETAITVAQIRADAIAEKQRADQLEKELDEIYRLLNIDSQASVTANNQPA